MAPEAIKQPRPHSREAGASGPVAAPPFHRSCLGMCSAVALHLFCECRRSVEELMNRCRGLSGVTTARVGTQCPAQFRCSICGGFAIRHRQDSDYPTRRMFDTVPLSWIPAVADLQSATDKIRICNPANIQQPLHLHIAKTNLI